MGKKERDEQKSAEKGTPKFETEEQEADYWATYSPLDLTTEPKMQRVHVKGRGVKEQQEEILDIAEEHWKWLVELLHYVYITAWLHGAKHEREQYLTKGR